MKYTGKLTLRNDFHNTEATVKVNNGRIKADAMKRAEKKLCGMKECSCGGMRGPQDMIIEQNHRAGDYTVSEKGEQRYS